jgi:hypothetical protein
LTALGLTPISLVGSPTLQKEVVQRQAVTPEIKRGSPNNMRAFKKIFFKYQLIPQRDSISRPR